MSKGTLQITILPAHAIYGRCACLTFQAPRCVPADYVKALALGADGIALSNAPIQAVGCIGARLCNTDRCPTGVATQDPALRALIDVDYSTQRVARFFTAAVELMQVMARACGHDHLSGFRPDDIATWSREMADLTGIAFAGSAHPHRDTPR